MLRPFLFAVASALVLGACASTTDTTTTDTAATVVVETPFNLAMDTADELVAAGNTPTAIQRLMQLVGDTSLSPQERGDTLYRLGKLSGSPTGYDAHSIWADWNFYRKNNWDLVAGVKVGYSPSVDYVITDFHGEAKFNLISRLSLNGRVGGGNSSRFDARYMFFTAQLSLNWNF